MPAKKGRAKGGKSMTGSARAGVTFPVGRLTRLMRQGRYSQRLGKSAGVFMAAVLEYVVTEVLELATDMAHQQHKLRVTPRSLQLAIKNDDELAKLFSRITISKGGVVPHIDPRVLKKKGQEATQPM